MGKSTLFNAMLKKQQALVANYPFATIEPNVGIVPVPDFRLHKLAEMVAMSRSHTSVEPFVHGKEREPIKTFPDIGREELKQTKLPPIVPATVKFVDIAGLVKGANEGQGLGNKFLAHIREVDVIVHVVRAFTDPEVVGRVDPSDDLMIVKTELGLADLEMQERHGQKKGGEDEILPFIAKKPAVVAVNVAESDLRQGVELLRQKYANLLGLAVDEVVIICAKMEAELAVLGEVEQREYLASLGVMESGLEQLIKKAYQKLNLISFLTAGEIECRAWTIRRGTIAQLACGVIHTDFMKKFIKAEVVDWQELVKAGGWKRAREAGLTRMEGRDYQLEDGEVVEFKIGG